MISFTRIIEACGLAYQFSPNSYTYAALQAALAAQQKQERDRP